MFPRYSTSFGAKWKRKAGQPLRKNQRELAMGTRELKAAYGIPAAWRDLGLPGEPGKTCRSPFPAEHKNGDANASFSSYDDGRRAKDFATGEHFDVFDFIRKTLGCDIAEAIHFVRDRLGIPR